MCFVPLGMLWSTRYALVHSVCFGQVQARSSVMADKKFLIHKINPCPHIYRHRGENISLKSQNTSPWLFSRKWLHSVPSGTTRHRVECWSQPVSSFFLYYRQEFRGRKPLPWTRGNVGEEIGEWYHSGSSGNLGGNLPSPLGTEWGDGSFLSSFW